MKVSRKAHQPKSQTNPLWIHVKSLASTIAFVWVFTSGVAQATIVPTGSMIPTILVGDHFFLDKVAFPANYPEAVQGLLPERTIRRGDIVAFNSPEDPKTRLVKRVIGLPGETYEIRAGEIYINGTRLDEQYIRHIAPEAYWRSANMAPITLPSDGFFMMGDNRDDSRDSRYFGVVHRNTLVGKPMFIYWSYASEPYEGDRTIGEWAQYYASIATHFISRTRWERTGTILR